MIQAAQVSIIAEDLFFSDTQSVAHRAFYTEASFCYDLKVGNN